MRRLAELLRREERTIAEHQPKSLVNRCGYQLHGVLADGQLDLAKLLVGSEGTLALITEATVRTVPVPKHRGLLLLFFDRLDAAVPRGPANRRLRHCGLRSDGPAVAEHRPRIGRRGTNC